MLPVQPAAAPRKLTYADYLLIPEDGLRHEIIDGVEYVSPAPWRRHQAASRNLLYFLSDHLRRVGGGRVYGAPFDVVLRFEGDVVEPDLLYISAQRMAILTEENVQGAPDLVVEILSPGTRKRDETLKRERYRHFGVSEYWMVDTEARTVRVVRWRAQSETPLETGAVLSSPLLPGLAIAVEEIFAD